jgi:hypothetical protein
MIALGLTDEEYLFDRRDKIFETLHHFLRSERSRWVVCDNGYRVDGLCLIHEVGIEHLVVNFCFA